MAGFAEDHGVRRIAFELHPLYLVDNVPTLDPMRDAVGPLIGANVDPTMGRTTTATAPTSAWSRRPVEAHSGRPSSRRSRMPRRGCHA
jgi:hypothetical protein